MDELSLLDLIRTPVPNNEHPQGEPGAFGKAPPSFQNVGYVYVCDWCEARTDSIDDSLDGELCEECPLGLLHPVECCIHAGPEPGSEPEDDNAGISQEDLEWAVVPWQPRKGDQCVKLETNESAKTPKNAKDRIPTKSDGEADQGAPSKELFEYW